MTVKQFHEEQFMKEFQSTINLAYSGLLRWGPVILSLSDVAVDVCRKLRYAQWNNREAINIAIRHWWKNLPPAEDERFEKRLFRKDCRLASASGPTFVWIRTGSLGCQCVDLVVFRWKS